MRTLNEMVLADLIAARAEARPDLDVVTFEAGETGVEEVRTYAQLWANANRLAAGAFLGACGDVGSEIVRGEMRGDERLGHE